VLFWGFHSTDREVTMAYKIPSSAKARACVENALNVILDSFRTGKVVPMLARAFLHREAVPQDKWSFGNKLMAFIAGTNDGRTFKAWKDAGRKVKKGSSAFYVWVPNKRMIEDKDTGEKQQIIVGFHVEPRFRVEDTEGDPLPENEAETVETPPLFEVAQKMGLRVEHSAVAKDSSAPAWGWYSPGSDQIQLLTADNRVFFHELAHAGHRRVLEKRGKKLQGGQDLKQEAVAEICAATLSEIYGSTTTAGNSYDYIRRYADENNSDVWDVCMSVIGDVQKTLALILDLSE
jgi:antirestriction protein ArdC